VLHPKLKLPEILILPWELRSAFFEVVGKIFVFVCDARLVWETFAYPDDVA
jgi:hypothetical protein